MGDVKSQFVLGGYNGNNYLLDSFTIIVEDTRGGLNPAAATRLNAMAGFVSTNPAKTAQIQDYINKLTKTSEAAPEVKATVSQRAKPGNGIM